MNEARLIDDIGTKGIIENIRKAVEGNPVYLSIDIDVLDPSAAPATGTPESGGWTSRELRTILRGLEGLDIVGADLVEVSPPFDNQAEITQQVAADVLYEVMSIMVKRGPLIDMSEADK
jgi:agmatinase